MLNSVSNIDGSRHARRRHKLVRGACGALVVGVAWTSMAGAVQAAPSPVRAPVLVQGLVGLRLGAVGADVKAVQNALIAAGVSVPGGADGRFGPATHTALKNFQGQRGLTRSGEVDAATAAALGLAATDSGASSAVVAVNGLQQGAKGDAVKELQQKLVAAGIYVAGGADGDFGPGTAKALSSYQGWNGLTVSGVVDAATAKQLGLSGASTTATTPAPAPAPVTSSNPYVGLAKGAKGDLVRALQTALINAGTKVSGGADGDFGNATKSAVSSYQQSNGLGNSGTVDEATATKLNLGATTTAPATPTPPAATATSPYEQLKLGSQGVLVKELQAALIRAGVTVRGGADGSFGNATKSALQAYQQANGLTASGAVDAATVAKLALGGAATTTTPPATVTPAATSTNPYVGLALGASGDKVKDLQKALMATGLVVPGGADGSFGNATKTALQAFQGVNGIPKTGVLTEKGAGILNLGTAAATPSGFASTPDGFPKKGESSERVRVLQQLLIDWNISVYGGADGSFGNATLAALTKFQQAHGLSVTGTVSQETADKLGLSSATSTTTTPGSATSVVMKRFPIQGQCYYGNTWGAARGGGRLHEGVDIIANEGKLLYAVVDGTISKQYWDQPGALSGNGLRVAEDNGTYFTYLHMSGFAPGIAVGTKVKAGDVIGFVGNTGSSATPHVHFEIHPGGGGAVNPYPYVKAIDDCGNTTPQYQSSFS